MTKFANSEVEKMLKEHDWGYPFSSDQRKYTKGEKEEKEILRKLSEIDQSEAFKLWSKYAPENAQVDKNKFETMVKKFKKKAQDEEDDTNNIDQVFDQILRK